MGVDVDMCVFARVRVCVCGDQTAGIDAVTRRGVERVCRPDIQPEIDLVLRWLGVCVLLMYG